MKQIWIIFLCAFLTSCSLFTVKSGPDNMYVLSAVGHPPIKRSSGITLLVLPVTADQVYDTTQMIYSTKPYQISYFSKSGWAQTPAQMLQPLIIQTLQNTHFFHAVTSSAALYQYALSVNLIELQHDFLYRPSLLRLKLRAQIVSAATNQIIASRNFYITRIACQNNPYSGVIAANLATAEFLTQLAAFSIQTLSR